MNYEWDEKKNTINQAKHGVSFDVLAYFEWAKALTQPDCRKNYGEQRFVSISLIADRLFVLVWTPRGDKKRIIGLRKANGREEKYYESKT